jgi:hypothetical protein
VALDLPHSLSTLKTRDFRAAVGSAYHFPRPRPLGERTLIGNMYYEI